MRERSALRRLSRERRSDAILAVALTTLCIAEQLAREATAPELVMALPFGAAVAFRRTHAAQAVWGLAAALLATVTISAGDPPVSATVILAILAYSVGAHVSPRPGLLALAALIVAMQVAAGFEDAPNVEIGALTLAPWWAGREVQRRSQLVSQLAERTRELEAEQEAFTRLAVRRERARIARELHDIVTHHLAVMVIQAGAGRMADPARSSGPGERLRTIHEAGVQALDDMAGLVEILGAEENEAAGRGRLAQLLASAQAGESPVSVSALPAESALPPAVEETAYRVVQEGLTNAMKHAPGAAVQVRLVLDGDLLIEVCNDRASGPEPMLATSGSGLGLAGMRERIQALGGSMTAGPDDDGWCLRAHIPASASSTTRSDAQPPAASGSA